MSWFSGHESQSRKWAMLDRALVNVQFINEFHAVKFEYLARKTSDHKPIMLHHSERYGPPPFRFQNM